MDTSSDSDIVSDSDPIANKAAPTGSPSRRFRPKWERKLPHSYIVAATGCSLSLKVEIETTDTSLRRATTALVDSGATGLFMDKEYAAANNICGRPLSRPIPVRNVDGSPNEAGEITEVADVILRYQDHSERAQFALTSLGKQNLILGYTWLRDHSDLIVLTTQYDSYTGTTFLLYCIYKYV